MRLRHVGIGVGVLVTAGALTLVASGGNTSAPLWFIPTQQQPVAGRVFTGLVLDSANAQLEANCGSAMIGHKRVTTQNRLFFKDTQWSTTVCSWRIPKGSGGKLLRVTQAEAGTDGGSLSQIPALSWRVAPAPRVR